MSNLEVLLLRRVRGTKIICDQVHSNGPEPLCSSLTRKWRWFLETLHLTPGIFGESFWGANKNFYTSEFNGCEFNTLPRRDQAGQERNNIVNIFQASRILLPLWRPKFSSQIFCVALSHLQTTKRWHMTFKAPQSKSTIAASDHN